MNTRQMSSLSLIATTLLSNCKVLKLLQSTPFQKEIEEQKLRETVYLAYLPWAAREPDHVFDRNWKVLGCQSVNAGRNWWMPGALQSLASEFLVPRHGNLYVKLEKFGAWQQSVTSRISGLSVQAAGYTWPANERYLHSLGDLGAARDPREISQTGPQLPVITPYDPLIEDYIQREGLHETHLHLNGSTHAELCWLRALYSPEQETLDFTNRWNQTSDAGRKVRELALSINSDFSPSELRRQLLAAKNLRKWLIGSATGLLRDDSILPPSFAELIDPKLNFDSVPFQLPPSADLNCETSALDELRWQHIFLSKLSARPHLILERMFHCYLLLQNQYYKLLVQNEEQFGFDQFQKLTWTNLREPAEQDYVNRFIAMHGGDSQRSRIGYLEGRFAPQDKPKKNEVILGKILGGYSKYINRSGIGLRRNSPVSSLDSVLEKLEIEALNWPASERRHMRLALIAHFIKSSWDHKSPDAGPYRYFKLRNDLEKRAQALVSTLNNFPRLRVWLRGIDAAANELHAPPEVFASCFRLCRRGGITRRSYHVGEDFPHILSGLRHILDALELLDLRDGDRIGHGTAMGILPTLWLNRMPEELVVTKGDWMLDLLATWRLLLRLGATSEAYTVESELATLASQLFRRDISCTALNRAMRFRGLNIKFLEKSRSSAESEWFSSLFPLHDPQYEEARQVFRAVKDSEQDLDLLWTWLSDRELWNRSEQFITVKANFLSVETYLKLQQSLMSEIAARRVIVETLPSSNVRISQYEDFSEHHILRWMRTPNFIQEGDPPIMVSLGSDDPGIFAGDLNSEFYQVYATLRGLGLGDKEALNLIAPVNERGRQYRFHDPIVG